MRIFGYAMLFGASFALGMLTSPSAPWQGAGLTDIAAKAQTSTPNSRPRRRHRRRGINPGIGIGIGIDIGRIISSPPPEAEVEVDDPPPRRRRVRRPPRRPRNVAPRPRPVPQPVAIPEIREREILISFTGDTNDATINALAQRFSLTRLGEARIALIDRRIVRFRTGADFSVRSALELVLAPGVEVAQPNYIYSLSQAARRRKPAPQYAVRKLNVPEAHKSVDGTGVLVAVIDSAVNGEHPALRGVVAERFDALGVKNAVPGEHGTGMASIIAARAGMVGMAPGARLLSVAAFAREIKNQPAIGGTFAIAKAIDWAVNKKAKVLNLSFVGPDDPMLKRLIKAAHAAGIIMVAAAGNRGKDAPPGFPAAYDEVIAATAVDARDKLYARANRGSYISVAAPGVDVLVARRKRAFGFISGTSAAAAHISGAIALLLQAQPALGQAAVMDHLARAARDLGERGHDPVFGHGLLDVARAVENVSAAR